MPLVTGTRFGPYEVVARLGAGGMGEVYRARDTRLDRDVALKILPDAFAGDPERLARFEREAKTLASLNHPNIAQIYGVEEQGLVRALVMELVDGLTLEELIARSRALPVNDALPIARQIAAALDAAHEAGIIHRDLKPANVKVRDDGAVKVLDFGLAKAVEPVGAHTGDASNSPTLTARATQLGVILGTAAYMSPEQAKGRAVDRRADVWAFGAVLFEMLSGRRAFDGDDVSEVLASVLKTDPDWTALPKDLPVPVLRLLRRCLEKDPNRRLRDLSEGMFQVDEALSVPAASVSGVSAASEAERRSGARAPVWRRALPVAAAAALAAIVTSLIVTWRRAPEPRLEVTRFTYTEPGLFGFMGAINSDFAVTPDGRAVVFTAASAGRPRLFVRRIDLLDALPVPGGVGAFSPFVSPDGQTVGFLDSADVAVIKRIPIQGGAATVVARSKVPLRGACWTRDGAIVFGTAGAGLFRATGAGEPVALTTLDVSAGDRAHMWPFPIPGTDAILFGITTVGSSSSSGSQLAVFDAGTGRTIRLKQTGMRPVYAATGHIVYATADSVLHAVPFDLRRLEITGEPVTLSERVSLRESGYASIEMSQSGSLVYVPARGGTEGRSLVWVDRKGGETPIAAPSRSYVYARVSPEGTRLALDIRDRENDIWIWHERGALERLTKSAASEQYAHWVGADGQRVIFSLIDKNAVAWTRADGSGQPDVVMERVGVPFVNAVAPDGKTAIYRSLSGKGDNDLYSVSLGTDRTIATLLATEHDELNAALSPDGRWMAYQSDESGRIEIHVRPFPDVNAGQWTISTTGGTEPVWGPGEVFYLSLDQKLMSVPVTTTRGFEAGRPTVLFDAAPYFFVGAGRNYDVTRDGKRFVMIRYPPGSSSAFSVVVAQNWTEELKKLK